MLIPQGLYTLPLFRPIAMAGQMLREKLKNWKSGVSVKPLQALIISSLSTTAYDCILQTLGLLNGYGYTLQYRPVYAVRLQMRPYGTTVSCLEYTGQF